MLVNTLEFSPAARHFMAHGYYCDAPEGTPDWEQYWDTELDRCLNGYSVGGIKITGYHYFYLNYTQIILVNEAAEQVTGRRAKAVKEVGFPRFWDGDYNFYWSLHIAKYGITLPEYDGLGLDVRIRDLEGGLHLVVLKARGKGYSYKSGSILARHFNLGSKSRVYALADDKEYLLKDGLLTKAHDTISFLDTHTAWYQPRLRDLDMHKTAGYKQRTPGGYVDAGKLNELIGVTMKNDPDKARGKRGDFLFFEEAGKFPGLAKAWNVALDSLSAGAYTTGTMVAYGTGGADESNFESLQELFYQPEANLCLPFENIWDDEGFEGSCSFFVPAQQNLEGFMDGDGNSGIVDAVEFMENRRSLKRKSSSSKAYDQYVAENPMTPQEAMIETSGNLFPVRDLQAQLSRVLSNNLAHKMASHGILLHTHQGVRFEPTTDYTPIHKYPHRKDNNLTGAITIYEPPYIDEATGNVPKNMYILCHDPYAHDSSSDLLSLGASFVLKRTNPYSHTFNECIVASWVGRPDTQDEYDRIMFLLAGYYNCKVGFENDRGNVIPYAKQHHLLHMLAEEFEMLYKKELASKTVNRNYGMHMTEKRSEQGELYVRDWLQTPVYKDLETGVIKRVLNYIYDPALLQELIKFRQGGNFDRVKALMVGQYYLKEVYHREVHTGESIYQTDDFFKRQLFPPST
jgi:hypothetical protein